MDTAEWIIVGILAGTLFVFLICGIIFLIKLIGLTKEAKKVAITAQSIAQKADDVAGDVAENVRRVTYASTFSSLANLIKDRYNEAKEHKQKGRKNG